LGTRIKTFDSTGIAPNGRLYAGDLNAIQDQYADLTNLSQAHSVGSLIIGEAALQLVRYGVGEARISGMLRVDGILRGLGGIYAGAFTTAQRDSIPAGSRPYGLIILNTTTNQIELNKGTDAAPNWQTTGWLPANGTSITNADVAAGAAIARSKLDFGAGLTNADLAAAAAIAISKLAGYPGGDATKALLGDGSWGIQVPGVNTQAGSYQLAATDNAKVIEMNAGSANTLTVPNDSTATFLPGAAVTISQLGAGQTTIAAAGGVTLRAYNNNLKLAGQYAVAAVIKRAANDWYAAGNLVP